MTKTLVVDNWRGNLTQYSDGDINSGNAYVQNTGGNDPFTKPGNLTWSKASTRIDEAEAVITDLIMAGKERVESGILYVYAIGHTGRLYKIQVNDPVTYNPDYDNPVLLTTLTAGTPTFTRGGFIDFFGATEKIYIGHDKGVTTVAFNGTGEAAISGTWTQTVPRPLKQFVGKLYSGNGSNIAEIDSTGTQTTATKLSPGFPDNTQVRDIDVTPDGNYLQMVVTRLALPDITSTTQDVISTASTESYIFKWNGTDTGYTSFTTFPSFSLTSNTMFGNSQYTFGYDQTGQAIFNPSEKLLSQQEIISPLPNAISNTGSMATWISPLWYAGFMEADFGMYGTFDFDVGTGYWYPFFQFATGTETDIIQVPCQISVSNFGIGSSSNGYTDGVYGTPKIYFSTLETSAGPTTKYKFYKWSPPSSVIYTTGDALEGALYQTQAQLFSKKATVKEVRIYSEPWVANNSFSIELIGSSGTPMTNGSKTFTSGSNLTVGNDYAWWTPDVAPTYNLGLLITNLGTANFTIMKVEIDIAEGGQ